MSTFLLYASDAEWYEEASQQLRRGVSAATQGRFVIILVDEFLAKCLMFEHFSSEKIYPPGRNLHAH